MRKPVAEIDPVVVMLDGLNDSGPMTFTGVDLEDGGRATVTLSRTCAQAAPERTHAAGKGLLLVLSIETLTPS